ncbi:mitotic spindle assembly checkpoint protein MAD2A [Halyomorpha halys]|uniref:mitotic spindle assembly checkpoint protein MAD2A n=1 Tax=Halyomorpha halys TaxID=286706 RepID=UPI0006D4E44F|nr:mitotic spindle assembly checkpoint protein MAD2A [Halyomorpha halys]
MSESTQQTRNAITLKGSAKLVVDYLKYGINSILYQRGIYPPESFKNEEHFGLTILVSTDDKINSFLESVLSQIKEWLLMEKIQKLSLVITNITNKEVLERWDFKLQYEKSKGEKGSGEEVLGNKDIKIIQNEIQNVLRQICSTVSFLPLLEGPCSFDLLIYTLPDIDVPEMWGETGPCFIANSQELQLRSFSTSLHKMDTVVCYKAE